VEPAAAPSEIETPCGKILLELAPRAGLPHELWQSLVSQDVDEGPLSGSAVALDLGARARELAVGPLDAGQSMEVSRREPEGELLLELP
jgi:hypothetical protein